MFIDTNYFFRFLFKDIRDQYAEVESLFLSSSEGKASLITSTVVFFEFYWVLKSYYEKNKPEIVRVLSEVLNFNFIVLEERKILSDALSLFRQNNLDLEDCYNLFYAKFRKVKSGEFKTFDKKLEREFNKTK
ncbi:MAG: PilT protein [Candidatus Levybacteria bacterium]|nr:PilT protein [Candidatus Levybacteria bacterium]